MPGYTTYTWFKAPKAGALFHGQCAQLCGRQHAFMTALVKVVSPSEYQTWLPAAVELIQTANSQVTQLRAYLTTNRKPLGDCRMSVITEPAVQPAHRAVQPVPQLITDRVAAPRTSKPWVDWITTTDHKKIGIMYLVTTFVFFMLGGIEALLMRIQLAEPSNTLLSGERYNELLTLHGTTMVFLFVVPVMAGFGNYFVPLMIGARDMAFPRLNALSYWLLLAGGIVFYATLFYHPPEAGWWSYPPLSSIQYSPSGGQDAWIFLIHLTGISSLLGAINFYATIVNMRAPGMTLGPPAAVHLGDPRLRGAADHRAARGGRGGHDAADRPPFRNPLVRPDRARIADPAGSTCSGSSATPRSTSWSCLASGSSPRSFRCFRASRSSATRRSPRRRS